MKFFKEKHSRTSTPSRITSLSPSFEKLGFGYGPAERPRKRQRYDCCTCLIGDCVVDGSSQRHRWESGTGEDRWSKLELEVWGDWNDARASPIGTDEVDGSSDGSQNENDCWIDGSLWLGCRRTGTGLIWPENVVPLVSSCVLSVWRRLRGYCRRRWFAEVCKSQVKNESRNYEDQSWEKVDVPNPQFLTSQDREWRSRQGLLWHQMEGFPLTDVREKNVVSTLLWSCWRYMERVQHCRFGMTCSGVGRWTSIWSMSSQRQGMDLCYCNSLVGQNVCVYAFQENDTWRVGEMTSSVCVMVGCKTDSHVMSDQHCRVRRWWRCTATLIHSRMVLSASVSHDGHDEIDCITELELLKTIMEERKKFGAGDVLFGEDLLRIRVKFDKFLNLSLVLWRITTCSVPACIKMHAVLTCGGLIMHAILIDSRIKSSDNDATYSCTLSRISLSDVCCDSLILAFVVFGVQWWRSHPNDLATRSDATSLDTSGRDISGLCHDLPGFGRDRELRNDACHHLRVEVYRGVPLCVGLEGFRGENRECW